MTTPVADPKNGTAPGEPPPPWLEELPPRKIVEELNRFIVGQDAAKKAVAIAIRNRWRRSQAPDGIRDEITPYNIIMIGPTGVGKTEVARRLARLAGAPFVKVEASKFTEVGYVGRDAESMVRTEREDEVWPQAEQRADERLLDILLPPPPPKPEATASEKVFVVGPGGGAQPETVDADASRQRSREKLRQMLLEGKLDDRDVDIEISPQNYPMLDLLQQPPGVEGPEINFVEMLQDMMPKKKKRRTVRVPDARRILIDEELKKLVDMDDVVNEALDRTENHGILFIDEIDKIAGERSQSGPDVSREGVQRDLLPIVEGSTVQTRYGYVRTDHILFIAAGAFHVSKPSDLIPELQGRFPIRVELEALGRDEFVRILTEPRSSLITQYTALLATEGVTLTFTGDAVTRIAELAAIVNERTENIGARRLHTMMERLLDDVSFDAPDLDQKSITIDAAYVDRMLATIVKNDDLSRYVL